MTLALVDQDAAALEAAEEALAAEKRSLAKLLKESLLPSWRTEKERLDQIDGWYRWDPKLPKLPRGATPELRALRELSKVPWLGLVVTSCAQCMYVDGWQSENADEPEPVEAPDGEPTKVLRPKRQSRAWQLWQSNDMDHRQVAIHRAMLAYGYAYATVLPGEDYQKNKTAVIRGVSPRKMFAVYEDPGEDDWPVYAIHVLSGTTTGDLRLKLYDDTYVYTIRIKEHGIDTQALPEIDIERKEEHEAGVCPIVRYANQLDLDGRTPGEIEPHIPIAGRINKTSYDRMLVQHYNSWKVRTVTGMAEPSTQEDANRRALQLRQSDLLVGEDPDTRFGTLDETNMDHFIKAHENDVEALAAVTQTPTHELTGKLINVSAEGLAMIRASQQQKVHERQTSAGKSHAQALRLACHIVGDEASAADFTGRVSWQDTTIRSMAQAVDALGKAAQMLQIPAQALWGKIPGVTKDDVEEWIRMAAQLDPIERMRAELHRQQQEGGSADQDIDEPDEDDAA